jgi:hypothetical protein
MIVNGELESMWTGVAAPYFKEVFIITECAWRKEETFKTSIRRAGLQAEIQTRDFHTWRKLLSLKYDVQ